MMNKNLLHMTISGHVTLYDSFYYFMTYLNGLETNFFNFSLSYFFHQKTSLAADKPLSAAGNPA